MRRGLHEPTGSWRVRLLQAVARRLGFGYQSVAWERSLTGEVVVVGMACASSMRGLQLVTLATADSMIDLKWWWVLVRGGVHRPAPEAAGRQAVH